jgi:hypothetical protein
VTLLRRITPLLFAATAVLGHFGQKSNSPNTPKEPGEIVQRLYNEVLARDPGGIPKDVDMKTFAPDLSRALLRRIDLASSCAKDWYRQNPDPNLKPEFPWLEFGLFSGRSERADPQGFRILETQPEKDGSFRVIVELWIIYGTPAKPEPLVWHVAAIVVHEDAKYVVNDVIFLKDYSTNEPNFRLSEVLRLGCDGAHWIGYGKQRNGPKN